MERYNIAIDGPSAAGKSTISKQLAKNLGMTHLDTGAMYRCLALKAIRQGISQQNEKDLVKCLNETEIRLESDRVFLDGEEVTKIIREPEVSIGASNISKWAKVRQEMVARQQFLAKEKGFIMDGRDIGTVVLPDAKLKIFLVASVKARAKRRFLEEQQKNSSITLEEVVKAMEERDRQDETRSASPLKQARDAVRIDCSDMTIEEVVEKVCSYL
ncbi:cytidylate kinase [Bulleidia extructa W1219]|uniref:Cytidylate kinase n=1 Tax=Bulleidia extructa W1219 TaxID=679192 RepID=D2MQC2_9FIRM|nr:(d)CMP kinase [Bulleidia extructa]EFC05191.1 cytidylate kinase [Bulleidia extructa W1219]